jgi:hypothetical protein
MKHTYILILLIISTISHAQIVNIPDPDFKYALVNFPVVDIDDDGVGDIDVDTNDDGEIQVSEAENVISLIIGGSGIVSLEGIQSFVNLEKIKCVGNNLGTLDLSQNLELTSIACNSNLLTSLIIPEQLDLQYLICYDNQLTNLDVSYYPNLIRLSFGGNPIQSIDVTNNPLLEHLGCGGAQLTSLNVTQNPSLKKLYFWENEISNIDFSQNLNLENVQSFGNLLTSIDVSLNTNLIEFDCFNNQISHLDFSQNPNLTLLYCFNNLLTTFNIRNGNNTILEYMDVTGNPNLECIQVDDVIYANSTNWAKDNIAIYSESCELGVLDINIDLVRIFPNPATEILFIESDESIRDSKIYSMAGNEIKTFSGMNITVSDLTPGIYFLKTSIGNQNVVKRFIKN